MWTFIIVIWYFLFSNSLIIHQVKTKEITTVNEVLISIDFYDFTSPFTPWVLFRLRRHIKHSRQSFIGYPNTSQFVKNTPLHVVFSTLFSVFRYPDETLSLVFDVLHPDFDEILFVWITYEALSLAFDISSQDQSKQKLRKRRIKIVKMYLIKTGCPNFLPGCDFLCFFLLSVRSFLLPLSKACHLIYRLAK